MYFVITHQNLSSIKVRPCSHQHFPNASEVVDSFNVSMDKSIRGRYPIGTVFAVENLTDMGSFYRAEPINKVTPVCDSNENFFKDTPYEVQQAYTNYLIGLPVTVKPKAKTGVKNPKRKPQFSSHNELDAAASLLGVKPKRQVPVTLIDKLMAHKELKPPTIEDDGFYVDPDIWYAMLRNTKRGKNTLLLGPTGTGKTTLAQMQTAKLNRICNIIDIGSIADAQAALLGTHRIEMNEQGVNVSTFDYANFVEYVQVKDSTVVLEEITRGGPQVNNILFPTLDHRRYVPIEMADSKHARRIEVAEGVNFIGTANIGAEYHGTFQLDRALLRRFIPLEMPYMDVEHETRVLVARTKIDKKDAQAVAKFCADIRAQAIAGTIATSYSHGEAIELAELVYDGMSLAKAAKAIVRPLFDGTDNDGDRSNIIALITKHNA